MLFLSFLRIIPTSDQAVVNPHQVVCSRMLSASVTQRPNDQVPEGPIFAEAVIQQIVFLVHAVGLRLEYCAELCLFYFVLDFNVRYFARQCRFARAAEVFPGARQRAALYSVEFDINLFVGQPVTR